MKSYQHIVAALSLAMILAACTVSNGSSSGEVSAIQSDLAQPTALVVIGPAPELKNDIWLNTDHPLRLVDLRGKVVALEMWTFG